jgi:hypothetical protein
MDAGRQIVEKLRIRRLLLIYLDEMSLRGMPKGYRSISSKCLSTPTLFVVGQNCSDTQFGIPPALKTEHTTVMRQTVHIIA